MQTKIANAFPAKRFFVDMLVRDIELQDAILDLLDNCVDGAMRSIEKKSEDEHRPYEGFHASITFDEDHFAIEDNCGGIPLALAEQYAFRMGRADLDRDAELATVGVYGIGMKRAVFKLGKNTVVRSQTRDGGFTVSITPQWLEEDSEWDLPLIQDESVLSEPGTSIKVDALRDGIPRLFLDETDFERTLKSAIAAYYAFIIEKGFKVSVNGEEISAIKRSLIADDFETAEGITPYVYKAHHDGVDVSVTVGLYRGLSSDVEDEEALHGGHSSERAGWTVVCNDRVVLFADKTRVTGWGEATVPQYHTQFIAIAGTVILKSNDARKLPLTTTKRGIDGNSELYLSVKEQMREGLKLFTDFTNKWKKSSKELRNINAHLTVLSPEVALAKIPATRWNKVTKGLGGHKYKPNLPVPKEEDPSRQIRYNRLQSEIRELADYLFDDPTKAPGDVGAKCFDDALARARK